MTPAIAATPYPIFAQGEQVAAQLSDEDHARLAEIHELINLLAAELAKLSQSAAGPYGLPTVPPTVAPYTYSFVQFPYGAGPFAGARPF
jgi:hypothetical protein